MTAATLTAPTSTKQEVKSVALNVADRGDCCGAQAFGRALKPGHSTLLFCGHHLAKHLDRLVADGWAIDDQRHLINAKPSPSADKE